MSETISNGHKPENFKLTPDRILFVKAVTSVHAGAGTGVEHIDLPIQREQPTKFPIIYGSSFKGSLREYAIRKLWSSLTDNCKQVITLEDIDDLIEKLELDEDKIDKLVEQLKLKKEEVKEICKKILKENKVNEIPTEENDSEDKKCFKKFCKEIKTLAEIFGTQDNRGKITFTDLRILFFPVKSLKGVFAYVTCPYVLKRFYEQVDSLIGDKDVLKIDDLKFDENSFQAYVTEESDLVLKSNEQEYIVLEEFAFKVKKTKLKTENNTDSLNISGLKKLLNTGELYELEKRIVIVPDEIFAFLVQHYTEVVTRIKINPETGTVQEGALWTEEYLPAESVLYSVLFKQETSRDLKLKDYLPNDGELLNLGGNQTIGKGLVKVWYYPKNTSESPDREG
jgi:CRISPR-associated protein Cmr4